MNKKNRYPKLDVQGMKFVPVVELPNEYEIFDFSDEYDSDRTLQHPYGIGKYDEHRPTMYVGEQFLEDQRTVHMGIDIAGPVGTSVFAFFEGLIFALGNNDLPWDYGPTIITEHRWLKQRVFALHGHLSEKSLTRWKKGDRFSKGEKIAEIGNKAENGGWNPHLHFQLSFVEPEGFDLPGVVSLSERDWGRSAFPDPRLVLGNLY